MTETHQFTYRDLEHFCSTNDHLKEKSIAKTLVMSPDRFSKLKSGKYGLRPTDEEIQRIAALLNQTELYVRDYYSELRTAI